MPLTTSENPISPASPSALRAWILACRPRTLIAGVSPVLIGTIVAKRYAPISGSLIALCLLFSLTLQIAANWLNDYFDFMKGADTSSRIGPRRAVQAGWISPHAMKCGGFSALVLAGLIALPLLGRIGIGYLPLLFAALLSAVLYTGGKRPLGYLGLGEALVFFFYGIIATCGTALVLLQGVPADAAVASLAPGAFSCALLAINNLRDADEDRKAGKMTLTARFGKSFGRKEYAAFTALAGAAPALLVLCYGYPIALLASWLVIPFMRLQENLNASLANTGRLFTLYTILFCAILSL